uniref:Uncharacterized protein n=1 Tax=Anguilla anguilla TaxID=7936 RepID=A0A0E9W1K0_ANGAN
MMSSKSDASALSDDVSVDAVAYDRSNCGTHLESIIQEMLIGHRDCLSSN